MRTFVNVALTAICQANCPDQESGEQCYNDCSNELPNCLNACGEDFYCQSVCYEKVLKCSDDCPCFKNCKNGCVECPESDYCGCNPMVDPDARLCNDLLQDQYIECVIKCGHADTHCFTGCARDFDEDFQNCPCQLGCPDGCPCENYECPLTTPPSEPTSTPTPPQKEKSSVLVLNTYEPNRLPILLTADGNTDDDFFFRYSGQSVHEACSVIWEDQMFIYQGTTVSKLESCKLEKIASLPFKFTEGACAVLGGSVYLCFPNNRGEYDLCRKSLGPNGDFIEAKRSVYSHRFTRVAASTSEMLALGSGDPYHLHGELYRQASQSWHVIEDYPFDGYGDYMYYAPIVFHNGDFYVFGSDYGNSQNRVIGRLDGETNLWYKAGSMVTPREGHGVIHTGKEFLVVGGGGHKMTERCVEAGGHIECSEITPQLENYYAYPEMMMVTADFCKSL